MSTPKTTPYGLAVLRLAVGTIFLTHGVPKLLGGIGSTAGFFGQLGIPTPTLAAWGITLLEVGGGLLLILGVLVTPVAALFIAHMLTGIVLVHAANGWFVVGPGQGGAEFNVLLAAASLTLILGGPGAFTLGGRPGAHVDAVPTEEPVEATEEELVGVP